MPAKIDPDQWIVENSRLPLFRKGESQLTASEFVAHVNALERENAQFRTRLEASRKVRANANRLMTGS